MKKLLFVLPVVALLAAGCNSSQQATVQTQPTNQQLATNQNSANTDTQQTYTNQKYGFTVNHPSYVSLDEGAAKDTKGYQDNENSKIGDIGSLQNGKLLDMAYINVDDSIVFPSDDGLLNFLYIHEANNYAIYSDKGWVFYDATKNKWYQTGQLGKALPDRTKFVETKEYIPQVSAKTASGQTIYKGFGSTNSDEDITIFVIVDNTHRVIYTFNYDYDFYLGHHDSQNDMLSKKLKTDFITMVNTFKFTK
jgi:hypothetical protein